MTPHRFHVIKGTQAPSTAAERERERLRAQPRPLCLLQCPRCGGREVIETRIGVEYVRGRIGRGGTKQALCASCFCKGERVVLA